MSDIRHLVDDLLDSMYLSPETAPFLDALEDNHHLDHLFLPFREGYRRAASQARALVRASPSLTLEGLLSLLRALQCEAEISWVHETRNSTPTREEQEWAYAWRLGYQGVLTVLARSGHAPEHEAENSSASEKPRLDAGSHASRD